MNTDAKFVCSSDEYHLERIITVGIGWVQLASATSGFSSYIKACLLLLCSVAQWVRASD